MSIQSWKEEFYPVEAKDVPKEQAIQHSIRKFEGLREENLEKHGVLDDHFVICNFGIGDFTLGCSSCALCLLYLAKSQYVEEKCQVCPLFQVRGGVSCDQERQDEDLSPWHNRFKNPEHMIMWLSLAQWYEDGHIKAVPNDAQ